MECRLVSFGQIEIDGRRFGHDVVIEEGYIRRRKKGPSKRHRAEYGHTPLTPDETIPWSAPLLIVGTGANGRLPITNDLYREGGGRRRGEARAAVAGGGRRRRRGAWAKAGAPDTNDT